MNMEIGDLNLIGDFEAGIKCLQNPSLISKLALINKLPQLYSFWTCGALIIAVFATFTSVFNNIKLFVHHTRLRFLLSCQDSPHQIFDDYDDFDFDFSDNDDSTSSVAESDDDDGTDSEEDCVVNEVFRIEGSGDSSYFNDGEGQNGNFTLRRRNRFSWSDFSAGKSVVQLWDSFGLGLDFEDDESDPEGKIAIWDLDRDVKLSSGRRCQVAASAGAENVVLTAEMNGKNGGVGFATYDSRVDVRCPALYAAWRPRQRKIWLDDDDVIDQKEK